MASSLADTLEALAEKLSKTAQNLRSGSFSIETDTAQRMSLLKAGTDLLDAVSLPKDRVLTWLPQFAHITAIRLFIKWKAFEKIPTGDDATISYTELAAKLGADVSLISKTPVSTSSQSIMLWNDNPWLTAYLSALHASPCCERYPQASRGGSCGTHRVLSHF